MADEYKFFRDNSTRFEFVGLIYYLGDVDYAEILNSRCASKLTRYADPITGMDVRLTSTRVAPLFSAEGCGKNIPPYLIASFLGLSLNDGARQEIEDNITRFRFGQYQGVWADKLEYERAAWLDRKMQWARAVHRSCCRFL